MAVGYLGFNAVSIPCIVISQQTNVDTPYDANLVIISCLKALVEVYESEKRRL